MLIAVAFVTLFERKVLGRVQFRLGPTKLFLGGLFQPIADAGKLVMKGILSSRKKRTTLLVLAAFLLFLSWLVIWIVFAQPFFFYYSFPIFFAILAVRVFGLFFSGWGPVRKFRYVGGIRSGSQSLSYEVSLFLLLMCWFCLWAGISLFSNFFILLILAQTLLLFSVIAETNRAPLDLAEGESEIISGFNIEFSSAGFVFLFLGEYSALLFFSFFLARLFLSFSPFLFLFILIFIRTVYPRLRYDLLIQVCWFFILPLVIFLLYNFLSLVGI